MKQQDGQNVATSRHFSRSFPDFHQLSFLFSIQVCDANECGLNMSYVFSCLCLVTGASKRISPRELAELVGEKITLKSHWNYFTCTSFFAFFWGGIATRSSSSRMAQRVTVEVPSIKRVRKSTFAWLNIPSLRETTINWEWGKWVRIIWPMFWVWLRSQGRIDLIQDIPGLLRIAAYNGVFSFKSPWLWAQMTGSNGSV